MQNPSKEKQVLHNWLKIGKKLRVVYERTAGSVEPLHFAQNNDFPLVHSVTSHKSTAAAGISHIWLHWPHCLIKTCRWINKSISCSIRSMCSALRFSPVWCQFGVQNQCTKPCPAWKIDSSFFLLQEIYLLLWNIMKFWRLGFPVIGNIDMSK